MVSADIQSFRAYLNQFTDIAKADRFQVIINPPKKLAGYLGSGASTGLAFQCEQAEIPGRTISTFEARTYGPNFRYPYQSSYNDLNLTFLCMANKAQTTKTGLWEKSFFDDWFEIINPSPQSSQVPFNKYWNIGYRDDYATTITVTHFDTLNNPTYVVDFRDIYPLQSTPMVLTWNDDSQLKLSVSFAYTSWVRTSATPGSPGIPSSISTSSGLSIPGFNNPFTLAIPSIAQDLNTIGSDVNQVISEFS